MVKGEEMDEFLNKYDKAETASQGASMLRMPSMKDRLSQAVIQAEAKLADARRAKEILDNNPELEELLNIMQRSHF